MNKVRLWKFRGEKVDRLFNLRELETLLSVMLRQPDEPTVERGVMIVDKMPVKSYGLFMQNTAKRDL